MSNERIAAEEEGSVTRWLGELKEGESEATRQLWNRYFNDLVRLARSRLWNVSRAAADEEDAALDAFDSFRRGVEKGRFPKLDDREDLWRILVTITACKAADLAKFEQALKRNPSGGVRNEADLNADALERGGLGALPSGDPNPETEAIMAEECRRLFALLPDEILRQVAALKLEGFTNEEIAVRLDCGLSTVERRLRTIRGLWNPKGSG